MNMPNLNMNNVIDNLNGIIFVKDCNFKYVTANKAFLDLCEVSSRNDVIGIDDSDLITREHRAFYRKCDQQVLDSKSPVSVIEPLYKHGKEFVMRTTKKPLFDEDNKLNGILAQAVIVKVKSDSSQFMSDYSDILPSLTKRQYDCLYHYFKGSSLKQIGELLNLSPKTVSNYLEIIKNKLNCHSRCDLVKKALQLGMFVNEL